MKFNTKIFWRLMAIFAIMDICILMAGCGDWESEAVSIIGLLGPAIQSIIAILGALGEKVPATVMTTFNNWAAQAKTALATLTTLIQSVKTAVASAQPGIINQIGAGLQAFASQLQTILPELHVDDPASQTKLEEAFTAIIGFIGEIAALVPIVSSAKTEEDAISLHSKAKAATKTFKSNFNQAVGYFGKQYEI
jgi:hypothetical protein